jgi:hypothetical protein
MELGHQEASRVNRAGIILRDFEQARADLVGKAGGVIGREGGDNQKSLPLHGLRISIAGHKGRWPISTVKFSEGLVR